MGTNRDHYRCGEGLQFPLASPGRGTADLTIRLSPGTQPHFRCRQGRQYPRPPWASEENLGAVSSATSLPVSFSRPVLQFTIRSRPPFRAIVHLLCVPGDLHCLSWPLWTVDLYGTTTRKGDRHP